MFLVESGLEFIRLYHLTKDRPGSFIRWGKFEYPHGVVSPSTSRHASKRGGSHWSTLLALVDTSSHTNTGPHRPSVTMALIDKTTKPTQTRWFPSWSRSKQYFLQINTDILYAIIFSMQHATLYESTFEDYSLISLFQLLLFPSLSKSSITTVSVLENVREMFDTGAFITFLSGGCTKFLSVSYRESSTFKTIVP